MRKLIVSLMALSLLVLPAFAQSVRTNSLGVEGDDVEDIGNITTFPQLSGLYQNKLWYYAIDDGDDVWQATALTELMGYTVGVQLTDNVGGANPGSIGATTYGVTELGGTALDITYPDTVANILFAGDLGGGSLGVNLMWATGLNNDEWNSEDLSAATAVTNDELEEESASYIGVIAGYGMEEVGPLARLDASVGIGLPGFEYLWDDPVSSTVLAANPGALGSEATLEKDGGMDLEVNVQGILERSEDTSLRILVVFESSALDTVENVKVDGDNDGAIDSAADTHNQWTIARSSMLIGAKCTLNKKVNDGGLLVVGAGLGIDSGSQERTYKILADPQADGTYALELQDNNTYTDEWSGLMIPVVVAIEDTINDTVTLRLGAEKLILTRSSSTYTNDDYGVVGGVANTWGKNYVYTEEGTSLGAYDVSLSMGVGAAFNNFTINVETDADIMVGGPYWITGDDSDFGAEAEVIYSF